MSQSRRILVVLGLNVAMIAALVLAGVLAHSLSLLSEGADFLADSLALALGLLAIRLRDHHRNERATTWVALVNGLWLLILSVAVIVAAVRRLISGGTVVHGWPVLVVSAVAAVVMLVAAVVLGADAGREDLHMRSVLLDTVADGAAAAMVAIVGLILGLAHRWYWLDAVGACIVSVLIVVAAVRLLLDVAAALRAGTVYEPVDD